MTSVAYTPVPVAPPESEEPRPRPPATRRDRAFLGELPEDFLRIIGAPQPAQGPPGPGERLVPLTYTPQSVYRPPDNHAGKLKVTITQAKLSKNYGFTRMDPYCRIRIGHSVYETPTDTNGSKNPHWNKAFTCNLPRGVRSMYVEVFNERYLAIDDRIAWAYYEFPEDLFNGETVEEWVDLNGRQGEGQEGNINLIFSFTPAPPQTAYQISAYGNQPVSVVPGPAQVFYPGAQGYPPPQGVQGYPPPQAYPVSFTQPAQQPVPQSGVPGPTQGPVTGPPRVRDEDVQQLKEMFPDLEEDVVRSVLEASNGQVDSAVTSLLQMTAA